MARIAIPLAEDFEDSEFKVPYERLFAEGHQIVVFGSHPGETVAGKRGQTKFSIETGAASLQPDEFDALVIPGGYSPDHLRTDKAVVSFVERFCRSAKPVAAICHGPQLLIEADAVRGRTLTSYPAIRKDLENAGATWVDREVVVDGNLITSRKPEDLDAFCDAVIAAIAQPGAEDAQHAQPA